MLLLISFGNSTCYTLTFYNQRETTCTCRKKIKYGVFRNDFSFFLLLLFVFNIQVFTCNQNKSGCQTITTCNIARDDKEGIHFTCMTYC